MKLIKFIMVTALIFIFGDVFAQNTPTTEQDRIVSYNNHGTQVVGECVENSKGNCARTRYITCRPATESDDPIFVAIACSCSVIPEASPTLFSSQALEFVGDSSIDFARSVSRDLCLTSLNNLMRSFPQSSSGIGDVTYSCSEPSYCFFWHDGNGNGVYDPGEESLYENESI